jgi:hypothetical protein
MTILPYCRGFAMSRRHVLLLITTIGLVGCASASMGTGAAESDARPGRRDSNIITADELAAAPQGDLFSAIQQLRPAFLQTRGASSLGIGTTAEVIQVYVDGIQVGDPSVLRQYQARDIKEVRRLSASDATQKYGTGHSQGAILVTRRDR